MNYLDIILIIPLLWGIFRGFMRGLVMQIATFLAFAGGIWVAVHYNQQVEQLLREKVGMTSEYTPIIAFLCCFIMVMLLVLATGKIVERIMKAAALGLVNKILGAVVGFAKYAFLTCMIIFILDRLNNKMGLYSKDAGNESLMYKYFLKVPQYVYPQIDEIFELKNGITHPVSEK